MDWDSNFMVDPLPKLPSMADWINSVIQKHLFPLHHDPSTQNVTSLQEPSHEPFQQPLEEPLNDSNIELIDLTYDSSEEPNDDSETDNDSEIDVCGIEEEEVNYTIDHEALLKESENVQKSVEEISQCCNQIVPRSRRLKKPVYKEMMHWHDIRLADSITWRRMQEIYQNELVKISSKIDNFGVVCNIDIPKGQYIVEYIGERIPTSFVDYREKCYESQGLNRDYMFKIDENITLDATDEKHSNIAKYFNHSCEPNSKSEVLIVNNQKCVVITAIKRIAKGKEITWSYNLPYAKKGEKRIPCRCGTKKCKRYLN